MIGVIFFRLLGAIFLVLGIIGILTPIPFGIVFLLLAMLCILPTTPSAARFIRRWRMRSPRIDRLLGDLTLRLPMPYRRILRKTDPYKY